MVSSTMRKLHVLVLPSWYPTHYAPLSGVFFYEQAQALRKAGVRVGVVYPDLRSLRTLRINNFFENRFQLVTCEENGVNTVRLLGWNVPNARLRARLFIGATKYLVNKYIEKYGKPDLVHAHSVLWGGVAAREVQRRFGIPYVVTEHSSAYGRGLIRKWEEPLIRAVLQDAASIVAVSRSLSASLKAYAPDEHINVIPNLVNTDFFTLPPRPRSKKPFKFLTVASLTPNKAIDVLLYSFAFAFPNEHVLLEIGGAGEQRSVLERLVEELGLASRVKFLGSLDRNSVRQAMWKANAFVLPSYVETFGVVLIEAMATGLPLISTRSGGPEDIVTEDVGLLVNPGDVNQLSFALRRLVMEYSSFNEPTIRNRAIDSFREEVVVNRLLDLYNQVLELEVGLRSSSRV